MGWDGKDRRKELRLTDEEKREIALEVWKLFEQQVGHRAISLFLWVCGAVCLAGLGLLGYLGKFK